MTNRADIAIGDPVEVRFIRRIGGGEWRSATVVSVSRDHVGVAFANHERMAVKNGEWRRAGD